MLRLPAIRVRRPLLGGALRHYHFKQRLFGFSDAWPTPSHGLGRWGPFSTHRAGFRTAARPADRARTGGCLPALRLPGGRAGPAGPLGQLRVGRAVPGESLAGTGTSCAACCSRRRRPNRPSTASFRAPCRSWPPIWSASTAARWRWSSSTCRQVQGPTEKTGPESGGAPLAGAALRAAAAARVRAGREETDRRADAQGAGEQRRPQHPVQAYEKFLEAKIPTLKRYSGEGCEAAVPFHALLLDKAPLFGVKELIWGGAHRGRTALHTLLFGLEPEVVFRKVGAECGVGRSSPPSDPRPGRVPGRRAGQRRRALAPQ